ncbi:hypothetical protein IF2G_06811 [Cordyceps javanica]|nr:hypothetical protein IF2G_06811 [Cordyceps javanica]
MTKTGRAIIPCTHIVAGQAEGLVDILATLYFLLLCDQFILLILYPTALPKEQKKPGLGPAKSPSRPAHGHLPFLIHVVVDREMLSVPSNTPVAEPHVEGRGAQGCTKGMGRLPPHPRREKVAK